MRSRLGYRKRLATADGAFAFAMALASAVYANGARMPVGGVHEFLAARVTVMNAAFAGAFILMWAVCFDALNLYRWERHSMIGNLARITVGCSFMTAILVLFLEVSRTTGPSARIAAVFLGSSLIYETSRIVGSRWIATRDPQLVVILGSGSLAAKAWREIRARHHGTVKVVGFVDNRPASEMAPDVAARHLGTTDELCELQLRNVIDELLIAVPLRSCYDMAQRAIETVERLGVRVVYMQDTYARTFPQNGFRSPDLFSELVTIRERYVAAQVVKRFVDIVGSLAGLILLMPLFLAVALAVKVTSEGPVFFAQDRYGYRRRIFRMYKFRSMVHNASELMAQLEAKNELSGPIFKIRDDPRVTRLGRFLRASSFDELPQLWNVLIGNMSLVGPRPMSMRDVSLFNEANLMRRFTVRPGITGLWQVSGRSTVSFDKWIELDFDYIDKWSLALDFQIMAKTVPAVFKGTGV